jgi:hypothetical protein
MTGEGQTFERRLSITAGVEVLRTNNPTQRAQRHREHRECGGTGTEGTEGTERAEEQRAGQHRDDGKYAREERPCQRVARRGDAMHGNGSN